MDLTDSRLQGALRLFMLPHLSAPAMAALRGSCQASSNLVDTADPAVIRQAVSHALPPGLPNAAESSLDIQAQLRSQADMLRRLKQGSNPTACYLYPMNPGHVSYISRVASPTGRRLLVHLAQDRWDKYDVKQGAGFSFSELAAPSPEGQISGEMRFVELDKVQDPNNFSQMIPCPMQPYFISRQRTGLAVLDCTTAAVLSFRRASIQAKLDLVSPAGTRLLVKQARNVVAIDIPHLQDCYTIEAPQNAIYSEAPWQPLLVNWCSSGEHFAVWWQPESAANSWNLGGTSGGLGLEDWRSADERAPWDGDEYLEHAWDDCTNEGAFNTWYMDGYSDDHDVVPSCVMPVEEPSTPDEEPSTPVKVCSADHDGTLAQTTCFISIHSAQDGSQIGMFDASLHLGGIDPWSWRVDTQLEWSPAHPELLVHSYNLDLRCLQAVTIQVDGLFAHVDFEATACRSCYWSPCGRFICTVSIEGGAIYSIETGTEVHRWKSVPCPHDVMWSPTGSLCLLPGHALALPDDTRKVQQAVLDWDASLLAEMCGRESSTRLDFSPCSKRSVGRLQGPAVRSGVWHFYPDLAAQKLAAVHVLPGESSLWGLAWHPAPEQRLYAIADYRSTGNLIDGRLHMPLQCFQLQQPDAYDLFRSHHLGLKTCKAIAASAAAICFHSSRTFTWTSDGGMLLACWKHYLLGRDGSPFVLKGAPVRHHTSLSASTMILCFECGRGAQK